MRKTLFLIIIPMVSCSSPKAINQYHKLPNGNKERVGYWIEKESDESGEYLSKGNYEDGVKIGVWKTTLQGKRYHQEKIKKGIAKVKYFHPNGRLMEKGNTQFLNTESFVSWEKIEDWKYYDDKGKLKEIRTFAKKKRLDSIICK